MHLSHRRSISKCFTINTTALRHISDFLRYFRQLTCFMADSSLLLGVTTTKNKMPVTFNPIFSTLKLSFTRHLSLGSIYESLKQISELQNSHFSLTSTRTPVFSPKHQIFITKSLHTFGNPASGFKGVHKLSKSRGRASFFLTENDKILEIWTSEFRFQAKTEQPLGFCVFSAFIPLRAQNVHARCLAFFQQRSLVTLFVCCHVVMSSESKYLIPRTTSSCAVSSPV